MPSERRRFVTTTVEVEGRDETKVVELPDRELAAWGADERLHVVGQPVERVDAAVKVTGAAMYTADTSLPGMLHAVLVRSAIAKGRTVIDLTAARRLPGVVDAMAFDDLPTLDRPIRAGGVKLFDPEVSYVGQPLAVVCAETLAQARIATRAVRVSCEPVVAAVTLEQALAPDAPPVRPKGNRSRSSPQVAERGDVEGGLADAEVRIQATYRTPSVLHSAMEPHGAVAQWSGDLLTIHEGTQGISMVRDDVAAALELSSGAVRVVMEHMGGGFGAKNHAGAHTLVAALLARRTGRPVRCLLDRRGEQSDTGHRAAATMEVTLGARRDGRLTAIVVTAAVDQGVSGWEAAPGKIFHELYACPNVRTTETFGYTNTQAMAAFRGPGHVEGAFALERAMDELAAALGMDPLALRLRNHAAHDQEKSRPYSSGSLGPCLEAVAERFGWASGVRGHDAPAGDGRMTEDGGARRTFPAGGPPLPSRARHRRSDLARGWRTARLRHRPHSPRRLRRRPHRNPGPRHRRPHHPRPGRRRGARRTARRCPRHPWRHGTDTLRRELVGLDDHPVRRAGRPDGGGGRAGTCWTRPRSCSSASPRTWRCATASSADATVPRPCRCARSPGPSAR